MLHEERCRLGSRSWKALDAVEIAAVSAPGIKPWSLVLRLMNSTGRSMVSSLLRSTAATNAGKTKPHQGVVVRFLFSASSLNSLSAVFQKPSIIRSMKT
jgi:hypothetical protein